MKTKTKWLVVLFSMIAGVASAQIVVEPLGLYRYTPKTESKSWGAGVGVGASLNAYVSGHVRLLTLEKPDAWRGGAIDEIQALVEGKLMKSANGKVSLSAIGGVVRNVNDSAWGLTVGPRVSYELSKRASAGAELQFGINERSSHTWTPVVALRLSF